MARVFVAWTGPCSGDAFSSRMKNASHSQKSIPKTKDQVEV
jgi:hypothetical protein